MHIIIILDQHLHFLSIYLQNEVGVKQALNPHFSFFSLWCSEAGDLFVNDSINGFVWVKSFKMQDNVHFCEMSSLNEQNRVVLFIYEGRLLILEDDSNSVRKR